MEAINLYCTGKLITPIQVIPIQRGFYVMKNKIVFFAACLSFCLFSQFSFSQTSSVSVIAENLNHPWSLALLPDGRFLVTERAGSLHLINQQGEVSDPIAGLPKIAAVGQGGLLDVVLHPEFEKNRWIYLSFVAGSSVRGYSTEVMRAKLQKNLTLTNQEIIFQVLPKTKGGRHFGSRLLFDKKNYLFISLGDRGLRSPSQDLTNHIGSIIRLHDDGRVPSDNPFVPFVGKKNYQPEIFSYGHRNVQGLALHPTTGEVWAHEHGPQGGDELNKITAGRNYGWPVITYGVNYGIGTSIGEGTHKQGMEQPKYQWTPSIAPSGLAFYKNQWLVGALKYQLLAVLSQQGNSFNEKRLLEREWGRIRDVRVKNNNIYLLTDSNNGKLLKVKL
jgi:glucose/arabinose dehydrogenase